MITGTYIRNRPLINSLLSGLLYFVFTWSVDFSEGMKGLYMLLMLFLPGITFPLLTSYYNLPNDERTMMKLYLHIVLSVLIYHACVWLYTGEGRVQYITLAAGAVGSLLYLLVSKYILRKKLSLIVIVMVSILSGLVFLPYELQGERLPLLLATAIFLWTLINGLLLNSEYRTSNVNTARAVYSAEPHPSAAPAR